MSYVILHKGKIVTSFAGKPDNYALADGEVFSFKDVLFRTNLSTNYYQETPTTSVELAETSQRGVFNLTVVSTNLEDLELWVMTAKKIAGYQVLVPPPQFPLFFEMAIQGRWNRLKHLLRWLWTGHLEL